MDAKYTELFTLLTQAIEVLAEQVMEEHQKNGEEKGYDTAKIMRDDYAALRDKLSNNETLVKADYARLLVGCLIFANQLINKIERDKKALQDYKINIIPKLDQINNATTEEEVAKLAEELFQIKDESENEQETNIE